MRAILWLSLILVPALVLLGACGGDDDDDGSPLGGDRGDQQGGNGDGNGNGNGDGNGNDGGNGGGPSNLRVEIPEIEDGSFSRATLHIEISGDQSQELDIEGSGIATGGFALLTYGGVDASVQIALQAGSDEPPGAVIVTTEEVVTGGEWGTQCSIEVTRSGTRLEGEFSCDDVVAIVPGSTRDARVDITGNFTADR